jgi:hypothetical protein
MFCPFCDGAVRFDYGKIVAGECTTLGYFPPDVMKGHLHDNNVYTFTVECVNGHKMRVTMRKSCPIAGCRFRREPLTMTF